MASRPGHRPERRGARRRHEPHLWPRRLLLGVGTLAITALISPYRDDRQRARALVDEGQFVEVYVAAPLEVCERRDPKGLYKKARAGGIPEFTGVSAPYEPPQRAEIVVDTEPHSVDECVAQIVDALKSRALLGLMKARP